LPLFVGADPGANGAPGSFFAGCIDDVRLSKVARYAGESAAVPPRHARDDDSLLLLHLDADFGPWSADSSGQRTHAIRTGAAHCTVESRPSVR
jgi:hypothetical protein